MPNKNRLKGDRWERRVKSIMEKDGFYVNRQPGSKFPDLICLKCTPRNDDLEKHDIRLIECKVKRKYFSKKEREDILIMAEQLGATPILAYRDGRKPVMEKVVPK